MRSPPSLWQDVGAAARVPEQENQNSECMQTPPIEGSSCLETLGMVMRWLATYPQPHSGERSRPGGWPRLRKPLPIVPEGQKRCPLAFSRPGAGRKNATQHPAARVGLRRPTPCPARGAPPRGEPAGRPAASARAQKRRSPPFEVDLLPGRSASSRLPSLSQSLVSVRRPWVPELLLSWSSGVPSRVALVS